MSHLVQFLEFDLIDNLKTNYFRYNRFFQNNIEIIKLRRMLKTKIKFLNVKFVNVFHKSINRCPPGVGDTSKGWPDFYFHHPNQKLLYQSWGKQVFLLNRALLSGIIWLCGVMLHSMGKHLNEDATMISIIKK